MLPGEQAVPRVPCACSQPSKMSRDQVLVGFAELSQHISAPEEHREAAAVSCCCFPVASGLFLGLCQLRVGCVWSKAPPCSFSILLHQICICLPEYPGNSGLGNPHRNPPFSPSSQNIKPRTKKNAASGACKAKGNVVRSPLSAVPRQAAVVVIWKS